MDQEGRFQKTEKEEKDAAGKQKAQSLMPLKEKMSRLLQLIGNVSECTGCKAVIIWINTKMGESMPLDPDGVPHWASCRNARDFKKRKGD